MEYSILFLLFISSFFSTTTSSHSTSVIVIGAGMSGISAAKTLYQAEIKDILILETSSRIGDRMRKTEFVGYPIEMGANWFYNEGPVANPVIEMAKEVNLRSYLNDYSNVTANVYKQEGGMYSKEEVDKLDKVFVVMEDYCNKFAKMLSRKSDKDADLSTLAGQRLYGRHAETNLAVSFPDFHLTLYGRVPSSPLEMVMDYYYNDYEDAEPPRATSLKCAYPRTEIGDPHIVMDPRGYGILVEYLASQILKKGSHVTLKLKKVVREIVYSKNKVRVKTEDGSSYTANRTIVSASLGVLQSDLIKFKSMLSVR